MRTPQIPIWPGVNAHASGAIWIEEPRALLLADLHLGYGWAQRRRGQLGPVEDYTPAAVVAEFAPRHIVLLGDIVHAPNPAPEERHWIESVLRELNSAAQLTCIRGNHDRAFAEDFASLGLPLAEDWHWDNIRAVHGDQLPLELPTGERWILGHWHPAIRIEDSAAAGRKLPAFVVTDRLAVMPAFSPFAAGSDVWRSLPEEIAILSGDGDPDVIAVTGRQAVRLGPLGRLRSPAEGARPAKYQRRRE